MKNRSDKKDFPVCFFTKDRTACACACASAIVRNLTCGDRHVRYVVCDDGSRPGHLDAVYGAMLKAGAAPGDIHVHTNTKERHGLGASMNRGLEDAFETSYECLRMEDDWLLKRPLDVGVWADCMDRLSIGSVRLGMMFRAPQELVPLTDDLYKLRSWKNRRFSFNNQVAIVTDAVYQLLGRYPENVSPVEVECHMADRYNAVTDKCLTTPYVCWPRAWATNKFYDATMPFAHVGVSTIKHKYKIPASYAHLNNPREDQRLRDVALAERRAREARAAERSREDREGQEP